MNNDRDRIIAQLVSDFAYEFSVLPDGTLKLEWMGGLLAEEIAFDTENTGIDAWLDLIHPDDLSQATERLHAVLAGKLRPADYRVINKDGEIRWLRAYNQPIWDDEGRVVRLIGAAQDITESKRASIALQESEDKYRATLDAMGDAIHVVDVLMNVVLCNESARSEISALGYGTDPIGRCLYDLLPFIPKKNRDEYRHVFDSGEVLVKEDFFGRQEQDRFVESRKIPILRDGEVVEVVTVIRDITERKRAEMSLRQSEERLQLLLASSEDLIFMQNREGIYLYYNGPDRYSISTQDVVGKRPEDFWPPEVAAEMMERIETIFSTGQPIYMENEIEWRGETLWFSDFFYPVRRSDGTIIAMGAISRNITERKLMEEALRQSEERYRLLVENLQEGICMLDENSRFIFTNQQCAKMLGYTIDEMMGRHPFDFTDASQVGLVKRALENRRRGTRERFDLTARRKDGTPVFVYVVATPIIDDDGTYLGALAGMVDISERRKIEMQLKDYADHLEQIIDDKVRELEQEHAKVIHAGRLAALGELATSVAHELRQPLAAIRLEADCLEIVADKAESGTLDAEQLKIAALDQVSENLIREIERCERIINHLRVFGRISDEEFTEVNLNQPIESSFILIDERLRQHGVKVERQLASDLPPILGNPTRLEQVFINLVSNAAHAMEEMSRRVMIGEAKRDQYERRLEIATFVKDGKVVATVSDNGCGIPEEFKEHVFESFFTTKPLGEGTGLGLPISQGIVDEHKGTISFESTENEGTVFTVQFPILGRYRE
jgi:PAS domain S-box-containing protein